MIDYVSGTALNPGNVPDPKTVDKRWIWFIDEPISPRQVKGIRERLDEIGLAEWELTALLGTGYESVEALSKWAASWVIGELDVFLKPPVSNLLEVELKAWIANRYRERQPELRAVVVDD